MGCKENLIIHHCELGLSDLYALRMCNAHVSGGGVIYVQVQMCMCVEVREQPPAAFLRHCPHRFVVVLRQDFSLA